MARACMLSAPYFYIIHCNNNKSLYDQIDSKLIGSNIFWKKTSQTVTIDKDDCAFSVVCSFLKIKSKAYIFENISTIFKWQNKSCWQKSADVIQWFCFSRWQSSRHSANARELERLLLICSYYKLRLMAFWNKVEWQCYNKRNIPPC